MFARAMVSPVPYSVPDGGNIVFELYGNYAIPAGDNLHIELVDCEGDGPPEPSPPWYQMAVGISPDIKMGFKEGVTTSKGVDSGWGSSTLVEPMVAIGYSKNDEIERSLDLAWKGLGQLYKTNRAGWKRLLAYDARVQALWRNLGMHDLEKTLAHKDGRSINGSVEVDYGNPPPKDFDKKLAYDDFPELDIDGFDVPWGNPPTKDKFHKTVWGKKYYQEICTRVYESPIGLSVDLDLHVDIMDVGTGDHINMYFDKLTYDRRCKWREPSGWRDAYDYRPPKIIPQTQTKKCWILMNTALLKRVSDNKPLDVKSMTHWY